MARFSVVLSIAVVAVVALCTKQVLAQGVLAENTSDAPSCYQPDSSDCAACAKGTPCCNLQIGQADNGNLYAMNNGTCSCCQAGSCERRIAASEAVTPNTDSNALVFDQICTLAAQ